VSINLFSFFQVFKLYAPIPPESGEELIRAKRQYRAFRALEEVWQTFKVG
jgi:hypothetical protein